MERNLNTKKTFKLYQFIKYKLFKLIICECKYRLKYNIMVIWIKRMEIFLKFTWS